MKAVPVRFFLKIVFVVVVVIIFLERGRDGGERNIDMREKH